MAIRTELLKGGGKIVFPLGMMSKNSDADFQISVRALKQGEPGYVQDRDMNVSPIVSVRAVHGIYPAKEVAKTSNANKMSGNLIQSNTDPDKVPTAASQIEMSEFQPLSNNIDLASNINSIGVKGMYCSAILIDDENGEGLGDLVVTVIS